MQMNNQNKRCAIILIVALVILLFDNSPFNSILTSSLQTIYLSNQETTHVSEQDTETDGQEEVTEATTMEVSTTEAVVTEASSTAETMQTGFIFSAPIELSLKYDDRYSFSELAPDYSILQIETEEVSSYVVKAGKKTDTLDAAVVSTKAGTDNEIIATGVGTATVWLAPSNQLEEAAALLEDSSFTDKTVEILPINVTVSPADLTLMFLAGQSNMEGSSSCITGYHPEDSILCEEGQIYSTYAPSDDWHAMVLTQNYDMVGCSMENVNDFIAASLTSTMSISGDTLSYPLNSLSEAGTGKTGPDSGLGYEWNRLTGDKVWLINAAWAGSFISQWKEGAEYYQRAELIYQTALNTFTAEVKAGHYIEKYRLFFWLQGESDLGTPSDTYSADFLSMYNGLKDSCLIQYFGLISVRNATGAFYPSEDEISMNGPRTAQNYLAESSKYPDIVMASDVNEQWVTDEGVETYFEATYPDGVLSYPLRSNATVTTAPYSISGVNGDIHYSQTAHNENGITAARGMYQAICNSANSGVEVK